MGVVWGSYAAVATRWPTYALWAAASPTYAGGAFVGVASMAPDPAAPGAATMVGA